jgi:hypothetical protein
MYVRVLAGLLVLMSLLFVAASPFARGETVTECQARLKDPVRCYVTEAKGQLVVCSLEIQVALLKKQANFASCIENAKQDVDPFFIAARDALAENKSAQGLLKDAHAYWLSSLTALIPSAGERRSQYDRRLQQLQQGFDEKANRLLLEK